uniref:non-specific serine/threonine protein kinase n=1 Tax=Albugo laibachii Nc14 TaxID=890382 RepID=F0WIY5_9STRA|nr:protein kinase putative [Albugo laibachii Nc14]|eukprot:CCA21231.1 protein kinase putative [Albugo laibachii Nc14]
MRLNAWESLSQTQQTEEDAPSMRLNGLLDQDLFMVTEKKHEHNRKPHGSFSPLIKPASPSIRNQALASDHQDRDHAELLYPPTRNFFVSDSSSLDSSESTKSETSQKFAPPYMERFSSKNANSADFFVWENPSYLVKNLDTGESYHVEEMDHIYTLASLDAVSRQAHLCERNSGLEDVSSDSVQEEGPGFGKDDSLAEREEVAYPFHLLSLYTADETTEFEIEELVEKEGFVPSLRARSHRYCEPESAQGMRCQQLDCRVWHSRASGFCPTHEIAAKEEEDSRAQTLYLIPKGARAEFVKISGHGFAYDVSNRLYTVYAIEMRCPQSGATWVIYRRYQEFKALYNCLRPMGLRIPSLPPKKLLGSFEPEFIVKRQEHLTEWLKSLLSYDRVDDSSKNPHFIDQVRKFLTYKADQPPLLLSNTPPRQSRLFGVPVTVVYDDSKEAPDGMKQQVTLQDFKMLQVIGRGSFGIVVLVGHRDTKKLYAMKILSKENIMKRKQVEHTRTERRVLGYTKHPFIVGLHYAFQTPRRLYFVLDYCPGGELFYHLSRMKKLPEHMACFYAAQITLALEHLHATGVVYRDLKPENILLTKEGDVKLADFGLAKEGIHDGVYGTNSLCGTPEYLPPEILDRMGHGTAVDWWNLGMVLYEMLTGLPPWYTNDRKKLFERLRSARLQFPPYVSRHAESIIRQLLNRNPKERLGANGCSDVKTHPFFEDIDWDKLLRKEIQPPFRPCHTAMNNGEAPLNFDSEFTRLPLPSADPSTYAHAEGDEDGVDNATPKSEFPTRKSLSRPSDSHIFAGFTYENPSLLESIVNSSSPEEKPLK